MIAIRGLRSSIAREFTIVASGEHVVEIGRNAIPPYNVRRYLICQGVLYGKKRIDMTMDEVSNTYKVNYVHVACMCENILQYNERAKICVVGSESGISGSYDECYADAKRLLHHYVETKTIGQEQQLVCVAPSIIEDATMTIQRSDTNNLNKLRKNHPKGRFLTSREVARMIYFLLYVDEGYTTGTVIRMNGGKR